MKLRFRPLSTYPAPETRFREPARFKRQHRQHYSLFELATQLEAELIRAGATEAVVELDILESKFRQDGWPHGDARFQSPRVVLSYTHPQQGPLRFPCDTYQKAEDNLRAIVLSLEALRAIDRYGVTRRSEQYAGWKALPAETSAGLNLTAVLSLVVATDPKTRDEDSKRSQEIARSYLDRSREGEVRGAFRCALIAAHPDRGGDHDTFTALNGARATLAAHFGGTW